MKTGASIKPNYWRATIHTFKMFQPFSHLGHFVSHYLKDFFKSTNVERFVNPGLKNWLP